MRSSGTRAERSGARRLQPAPEDARSTFSTPFVGESSEKGDELEQKTRRKQRRERVISSGNLLWMKDCMTQTLPKALQKVKDSDNISNAHLLHLCYDRTRVSSNSVTQESRKPQLQCFRTTFTEGTLARLAKRIPLTSAIAVKWSGLDADNRRCEPDEWIGVVHSRNADGSVQVRYQGQQSKAIRFPPENRVNQVHAVACWVGHQSSLIDMRKKVGSYIRWESSETR